MSIQTALAAVLAEAERIEPGTKELPSVQCGVTADGVECVATIRVRGGTSREDGEPIPPGVDWESALLNLAAVLKGDDDAVDRGQQRLRALRNKAAAEKALADAEAELTAATRTRR